MHLAFLLLWRVPQSLLLKNTPTAWGCYQHTLLLGWYSACDKQSWFPSNMMLRIEVHQTKESCFSQSGGPLGVFLQIPSVFSCLHWGEDWVWPNWHKAEIGGVLQWCLSFCRLLLSPHMIMSSTRVTSIFFITTLAKALLHQLLSLARRPALGRVLFSFFYLRACLCSDIHYKLLDLLLRCLCLSKSYPFNWICHRLTSFKV